MGLLTLITSGPNSRIVNTQWNTTTTIMLKARNRST